jgi:hypothetical protein
VRRVGSFQASRVAQLIVRGHQRGIFISSEGQRRFRGRDGYKLRTTGDGERPGDRMKNPF